MNVFLRYNPIVYRSSDKYINQIDVENFTQTLKVVTPDTYELSDPQRFLLAGSSVDVQRLTELNRRVPALFVDGRINGPCGASALLFARALVIHLSKDLLIPFYSAHEIPPWLSNPIRIDPGVNLYCYNGGYSETELYADSMVTIAQPFPLGYGWTIGMAVGGNLPCPLLVRSISLSAEEREVFKPDIWMIERVLNSFSIINHLLDTYRYPYWANQEAFELYVEQLKVLIPEGSWLHNIYIDLLSRVGIELNPATLAITLFPHDLKSVK